MSDLKKYDISNELWREYDFPGRVYRINNPLWLYVRFGGVMHQIIDTDGIIHGVPIPGFQGCVIRCKNRDDSNPVSF